MAEINYQNTGQIIDPVEEPTTTFHEPTENEKELVKFIIDHTDRWRDYRNQNHMTEWEKYERIFRGQWKAEDKIRVQNDQESFLQPLSKQLRQDTPKSWRHYLDRESSSTSRRSGRRKRKT